MVTIMNISLLKKYRKNPERAESILEEAQHDSTLSRQEVIDKIRGKWSSRRKKALFAGIAGLTLLVSNNDFLKKIAGQDTARYAQNYVPAWSCDIDYGRGNTILIGGLRYRENYTGSIIGINRNNIYISANEVTGIYQPYIHGERNLFRKNIPLP